MLTNVAVREMPPMTIAAFRLALAAVLIVAAAKMAGAHIPRSKRLWVFALASAVIGNIMPFFLIGWSQQYITSALSGLLMAPMPLISLLLAHFLVTGERMNLPRAIGFMAGFGGIVILIGPGALQLVGGGGDMALLGQLASLGAMLGYAVNGIVIKRASAPDALGISAVILVVSAVIAAPLAYFLEAPSLEGVSMETWGSVILLGVGATALGQILLMKIIHLAGPPFLASVNYQVPLWATVFGVTLLGENLLPSFWIALAFILIGLAIAQLGSRFMAKRART